MAMYTRIRDDCVIGCSRDILYALASGREMKEVSAHVHASVIRSF